MKKNRTMLTALAAFILTGVAVLIGCDNPSDSKGDPPSVTSVTVGPSTIAAIVDIGIVNSQLIAAVTVTNGASQAVNWSVFDAGTTGAGNVTVTADGKLNVAAGVSAGTAVIRATSTFDTGKYGECIVTVSKAAITPSVSITSPTTYPTIPVPTYTGPNPGGGTVSFVYSTAENGTYDAAPPTNAGTYWVKASVDATANYLGGTSEAVSFTVNKDAITPSVSIVSSTYPAIPSPTYTGTNPGGGTVSFVYSTAYNGTYDAAPPTGAGTYWVKAIVTETGNYLGGTSEAVSFTIAAPLTGASIGGIVAPATGAASSTSTTGLTTGTGYTVTSLTWKQGGSDFNGTFAPRTAYTADIVLTATANYTFSGSSIPAGNITVNVGSVDAAGTVTGTGAGNSLAFTVSFGLTTGGNASIGIDAEWTTAHGIVTNGPATTTINRTIGTDAPGNHLTITVTGESAPSYAWSVNGTADTAQTGTVFNFDATWRGDGIYTIALVITNGSHEYSKTFTVTVGN